MIRRLLIGLLVLLALAAGLGATVLTTGAGLRGAAALAARLSGGRLVVGGSAGTLVGDWRLERLTIHGDSFDLFIGALSCSWLPAELKERRLHAAALALSEVQITVKDDGAADQSTGPTGLPQISLPLSFLIGSLSVDRLSVGRLGGDQAVVLDSFSAQLAGGLDRLEAGQVRFDGPYLSGTAAATMTMSGPWPIEAGIEWRAAPGGCGDVKGELRVSRTLENPLLELHVTEPAPVALSLALADVFGDLSHRLELHGSRVALDEVCGDWPAAVVDLDLDGGGGRDDSRGSVRATVTPSAGGPVAARFDFAVDERGLRLDAGTVSYRDNQAALSGALQFAPTLPWEAAIVAQGVDLPALLPVPSGRADAHIRASGSLGEEGIRYRAEVEDIRLSLPDHHLLVGGALSLSGDQRGLEVTGGRLEDGAGTVELGGTLNWTDGLHWQGEVRLDAFDPARFGALPAGSVSGRVSSTGHVRGADLLIEAEIRSLTGELSGHELSGGGLLVYQDQTLRITGLEIANGDNLLVAEGTVDERLALDFRFRGADLGRIYPLLDGSLEVEGSLSGTREAPEVRLQAVGSGLSYRDYGIARLQAELHSTLDDRALGGGVRLEGLEMGGFEARAVDLKVAGTMAAHRLSGQVELDRGRLQAALDGGIDEGLWRAEIDRLVLEDQQFGTWTQQGTIGLQVGRDSARVSRTCLGSGDNRICLEGSWTEPAGWSVAVDELAFELGTLKRWGLVDLDLSGTLAAALQIDGTAATIVSGSGRATVGELELDPGPNDYYQALQWFDTVLEFDLGDSDLRTRFSTRFVDGSSLNGGVTLPGLLELSSLGPGQPLQGTIEAEVRDLSALSTVTSQFVLPAGSLSARLALGGTLGDPFVDGRVDLQDGQLRIPMLGINLTGVAGSLRAESNRLGLELDGRSGEGRLRTSGDFRIGGDSWSGSLAFKGSDVELLNRRAISLVTDPDLALALGPAGGTLSGTVVVSSALVEVEKIERSASESSDVVFVDSHSEAAPWPFTYDLDVRLGDGVRISGHGLNARLGGFLKVASGPGNITVGRGHLDLLDGSVAVFGSPLTIDRGRLTFSGGPVDNPGLDIKASKFVRETRFGQDGVEVGVNLIGSAADFEMELFSVPAMKNSDILAYILLDKPLNGAGDGSAGLVNSAAEAIGLGRGTDLLSNVSALLPVDDIRMEGRMASQETSIVVGKNLSKELSVSYDYNLFKNAGSFRVRYEFGKGFSVESRNSVEANGVELIYSVER